MPLRSRTKEGASEGQAPEGGQLLLTWFSQMYKPSLKIFKTFQIPKLKAIIRRGEQNR